MKLHTLLLLASASLAFAQSQDSESMKGKVSERIVEGYKENPAAAQAAADAQAQKEKNKAKAAAASAASESTKTDPKTGEKIEMLPALQVEATKLPPATKTIIESRQKIQAMDEQIRREKENTHSSDTDRALNADKMSVMGNLSAKGRTEDAKRRIQELELKQEIAATNVDPRAEEENKKLLKMLDDLEYQKKH